MLATARITIDCYMKVQPMELMENLVQKKKKFSINFSKVNTKCCLSLHYNTDNSYLFFNGKEILL